MYYMYALVIHSQCCVSYLSVRCLLLFSCVMPALVLLDVMRIIIVEVNMFENGSLRSTDGVYDD